MEAVNSSHNATASSPSGRTPHTFPLLQDGPSHGRQSSVNCSNVCPSQGLQFFKNCSRVRPVHRVQSFRIRLLQHESHTESQVLPANLLQDGLLSPWGHRACYSVDLPQGHSLFQASTFFSVEVLFYSDFNEFFSAFPLLEISYECYYRWELLFLQRKCKLEGKGGLSAF